MATLQHTIPSIHIPLIKEAFVATFGIDEDDVVDYIKERQRDYVITIVKNYKKKQAVSIVAIPLDLIT